MSPSQPNLTSRQIGLQAETLAANYLVSQGYTIYTRNFHSKFGEIDIVATSSTQIIFCEVKYRQNTNYGLPSQAVDYFKLQKILRTCQYFLLTHNFSHLSPQIDVISIAGQNLEHFPNITAFSS